MPEWLSSLHRRVLALVRRRQLEADFQDELAFHLAMREEQLRSAGAPDAGTVARRRFGSVAKINEDLRDTWAVVPRLSSLLRDLRYAARILRRSPVFATAVVLTLGLGIGANTAFFSVVNAVLIRPLGYADAGRLVALHESFPQARIDRLPFSALDFEDLRRYQQSFESVAAYRNVPFEVSGSGPAERLVGAKVSSELFRTVGVEPILGRALSPVDDRPGVKVAILSWALWQKRYAADPSALGERIVLDREPYTIVGVMPPRFVFPRRGPQFNGEPADVLVPIAFTERERFERGSMHANSVIGRLRAGVSLQSARAELDVLADRIAASYPAGALAAGFSPGLVAQPLREEISGRIETPLLMLLAAVGLVLLVACANVANLILSRAASRGREYALRTALGARQGQVAQLLLCEALLLSAAGGLFGIALASWAIASAPAVLTRTVPGLHDLTLDVRVLAFTAIMCLGTTLVFGLVPLAALGRRHPRDLLRDEPARVISGAGRLHIQRACVVVTVSVACVLLVGAGLFARSLAALVSTDIGFRPGRVLTVSMTLPRTAYATGATVRAFHDALYESLRTLPGVRSAATATDLPLTRYELRAFTPEGANVSNGALPTTSISWVHGAYFETLGMTLRRGRFFVPAEHVQNRGVVVVNEKLAALAWPGHDPIGRRLKWGGPGSSAPWLTIVGVVRNVADGPIGSEPLVHAYEPFRQLQDFFLDGAPTQFGRDVKAAILADGDPALATLVRQEIAKLDRDLAIDYIQSMEEQVSEAVAPQRASTMLVGAFAATALLLASVGLYGLVAFTTAQRRQEIAVRMALGAGRRTVMRLVIGQGARLAAIGVVAGLAGSLALTRLVASLLYATDPTDLFTFVGVPVVLTLVVLIACSLPAWRAAHIDPMLVLRVE